MSAPSAATRSLRHWGPIGLLLAVVALIGAPRFGNALVWDDVMLMDVAESLARSGDLGRAFRHSTLDLVYDEAEREGRPGLDLYRPLALLSFAAGYALGGRDPGPQHAFNMALHLACTLLVFVLARARGDQGARAAPLLGAAWFGLAPQLVEAHVWISGRFDLGCTLLVLIALLLWRAAEQRGRGARLGLQLATATAFAAALLCKEAALFVLPALPFWPGPGPEPERSLRRRVARCAPFAAAGAVYLALRLWALGPGGGADVGAHALATAAARFGAVVVDAIASLLLPWRVYSRLPKEDYDALGPLGLLACALVLAALAIAAWRARRRAPWFGFGLLWLCALMVPVAVVTVSAWPGFGRYLYLPATVFLIGAADAALLAYERVQSAPARLGLRIALAVQLVACAAAAHAFAYDFRDDDTLFRSMIAAAPDHSHGYGFLGIKAIERQRYREAVVLLRKAVEIAPAERRYLAKLGHALLFSGDREGARALARAAITRLKHAPEFHLLEAYSWLERDPARAARALLECLRQDPGNHEGLEAYRFLRTRHPRAALYRAELDRLAAEPRYAALGPALQRAAAGAAGR